MKKRIYYLVSGIIQVVLSVYMMLNADAYIEKGLEAANMFSGDMKDRMIALYENSGHSYVLGVFGLVILMNAIIMFFACQNTLVRHKRAVITCSVICFLFGDQKYIQLLAIINIVVMALTKRVNPEDFPKKVEKMPELKKEKVDTKKIVLAIGLLAVYFSQFIWTDFIPKEGNVGKIVALSFYLLMIVLSVIVFKDILKEGFREFRKHFRSYTHHLAGSFGKFLPIYFGFAFLMAILSNGSTAANQNVVESLPILLSLPLAIIYAPIVEESLFRGCIRRFVKNDKLFIVISAIAFGFLHTFSSEPTVYLMIVHALPYAALGGYLAYLYQRTNNICTNIFFHAAFNTFAMIMSIMVNGI